MARRATIVGSGPNGLAAAVTMARAGYAVHVIEAQDAAGGGLRTRALTLPGFRHDVCSAVHPVALTSPFFRAFGLHRIDWITPDVSFAHPLDRGRAALAWRSLNRTATELGADGAGWRLLAGPLNRRVSRMVDVTDHALLRVPRHPLTAARFAARAVAAGVGGAALFHTDAAAALFAGVAAHANTRLPSTAAAAAALQLIAHAHSTGWAFPRGGADAIAAALLDDLRAHGGDVETGRPVHDLGRLEWGDPHGGDVLLLDTSPRLLTTLPLPARYARAVRAFRYGPAAAKVDFALDGPVPWAHPDVARSPTVHVGGTRTEILTGERAVASGRISGHPYVLVVQPGVLDPSRAPAGCHTLWAYTHVPLRSTFDPTEVVTRQIERFAPGFRRRILASRATTAADRERDNPAEVGGDILGGSFTVLQAVRRPTLSTQPWHTPIHGVYLASSSTPPGPGVHGMSGWLAARQALRDAGTPAELADLFG